MAGDVSPVAMFFLFLSQTATPLAQGEISLCVCFTKHVWKKPNHTCLVISTHMCNKTHLCGQSHTAGPCVVCGFYHTHVGKTKHVWKQPHILTLSKFHIGSSILQNQTAVCISKYRVVLSVFVFAFDKYHSNILPNIYIIHLGRADPILLHWKNQKNCIIFHVCGNSHTHKTTKQQ